MIKGFSNSFLSFPASAHLYTKQFNVKNSRGNQKEIGKRTETEGMKISRYENYYPNATMVEIELKNGQKKYYTAGQTLTFSYPTPTKYPTRLFFVPKMKTTGICETAIYPRRCGWDRGLSW